MVRITKQTDYAILLLGQFARAPEGTTLSARELATRSNLPQTMAAKVLKLLARGEILESVRGLRGGYRLTRSPEAITVREILEALEGPVSLTDCATPENLPAEECAQSLCCPVKTSWQRLNHAIRGALDHVTLAEMTCPVADPVGAFSGHLVR